MNIEEMQARLDAVEKGLSDKGHTDISASIETWAGGRIKGYAHTNFNGQEDHIFANSDCCEESLSKVENWAAAQKDAAIAAKEKAVKTLGRAIDGCREAGVDADLVEPVAASFQAMSDNLLTDQRVPS